MGTLNHTGRSGWIWKVAEFSNLNQSELNTSCCCISKWRTNTTYTEWRWMRSWLCVSQKPEERGSFLTWRRTEPFMFPVLAPHSILPPGSCLEAPASEDGWFFRPLQHEGPTDSSLTALLSSHTVNAAWMRSIEWHFLFPPFGCCLIPL